MARTDMSIAQLRERLSAALVADALDAEGYRHQSPRLPLRPLTTDGRPLIGRAKTTLWANMAHPDPSPYELELVALDGCEVDDVFVAAAHGSTHSGIWGELLSTAARNRGCAGAIVDGMVRDLRQMKSMGFPVWALGSCVYDSKDRQRVIDVDVRVDIDSILITPGDLIVADLDGVVIVPEEVEDAVVERAWEKVHAENEVRDAIRGGMLAAAAFAKYGVL